MENTVQPLIHLYKSRETAAEGSITNYYNSLVIPM